MEAHGSPSGGGGAGGKGGTRVAVEIYGQQYALRGDMEASYVQELAARLDARMRDLAKKRPRLSVTQLAVLTALQTLDELVRLEGQYQRVLALVERDWERRRGSGGPLAALEVGAGDGKAAAPLEQGPPAARGGPTGPGGAAP